MAFCGTDQPLSVADKTFSLTDQTRSVAGNPFSATDKTRSKGDKTPSAGKKAAFFVEKGHFARKNRPAYGRSMGTRPPDALVQAHAIRSVPGIQRSEKACHSQPTGPGNSRSTPRPAPIPHAKFAAQNPG